MKCQACANEISENLKASIVSNFCPFCGKNILTPQQLYLKSVICQSILKSTAINPALLNLQLAGAIDSLASGISADLALKVDAANAVSNSGLVVEESSSAAVATSVKEEVTDFSSIQAPEKGGKVAIPDHLKPKNKKPAKALSREGSILENDEPMFNKKPSGPVDFDLLEQTLANEGISVEAGAEDSSILSQMSDSDFFVKDEEVVYAASKKADMLKQKLKNMKEKNG